MFQQMLKMRKKMYKSNYRWLRKGPDKFIAQNQPYDFEIHFDRGWGTDESLRGRRWMISYYLNSEGFTPSESDIHLMNQIIIDWISLLPSDNIEVLFTSSEKGQTFLLHKLSKSLGDFFGTDVDRINNFGQTQFRILNEGVRFGDMKGLISPTIEVDRYKPKIGEEEDTVVVAFTVKYEEPAEDLATFIQNGTVEHLDVDSSVAPEADGTYNVFVEFVRDRKLFEKLDALLNDINLTVDSKNDWKFISFKHSDEPMDFNQENFDNTVIQSKVKYRMEYIDK